jgi:Leucine-rich repeat (LRR) protein
MEFPKNKTLLELQELSIDDIQFDTFPECLYKLKNLKSLTIDDKNSKRFKNELYKLSLNTKINDGFLQLLSKMELID